MLDFYYISIIIYKKPGTGLIFHPSYRRNKCTEGKRHNARIEGLSPKGAQKQMVAIS